MKKILPIIICLNLSLSTLCQVPSDFIRTNDDYGFRTIYLGDYEPVPTDSLDCELIRVYYDYTYKGEKEITGVWLLQVGANTTRYIHERRYKADSIQRVSPRKTTLIHSFNVNGDPFHFFDSYFISDNKCSFICRFGADDIMYEETSPSIIWELNDSVANICGHLCRSASGTFRGRTYNVFYAEDIPVSSGPWKLSGLPGLILHADVDNGKFVFHAKQVGPFTGAPILWPKYPYIKVNRNQYTRMLTQMQQNFSVAWVSHLARNPYVSFTPDPNYVQPDLSWIEFLETE